jgi:predicted RNA polymerase sigma factor
MHDPAHIHIAILGARPRAIAALLRYFRDLDTAEEAFQEACLWALQTWPHKGPPRDQFTTLKINQDRSIGHQYRHAFSSDRNRSFGMIEPVIEPSDTDSQQFGRLSLR